MRASRGPAHRRPSTLRSGAVVRLRVEVADWLARDVHPVLEIPRSWT